MGVVLRSVVSGTKHAKGDDVVELHFRAKVEEVHSGVPFTVCEYLHSWVHVD